MGTSARRRYRVRPALLVLAVGVVAAGLAGCGGAARSRSSVPSVPSVPPGGASPVATVTADTTSPAAGGPNPAPTSAAPGPATGGCGGRVGAACLPAGGSSGGVPHPGWQVQTPPAAGDTVLHLSYSRGICGYPPDTGGRDGAFAGVSVDETSTRVSVTLRLVAASPPPVGQLCPQLAKVEPFDAPLPRPYAGQPLFDGAQQPPSPVPTRT